MKITDWGYTAFMATLLATTVALSINLLIEIPYQWQHIAFTGIPIVACGIVVFLPRIWRRMRGRSEIDAHDELKRRMETQIQIVWGPSLEQLDETISLAQQRIDDASARLYSELNGQPSPLYLVIELGYKSVRLARAIKCLCANGYADEAYALCRNLMELEANIWFIMVSGDAEGNCERYIIWDNAKFYRDTRDNMSELDNPPSEDKWKELTDKYNKCVEKYGEENLKKPEAWAIAYRERGSKEVKARNVPARAFHSMPYLRNDRHLLHDVWKSHWNHLNSVVHSSPQSTMRSQAAPEKGISVAGQSAYGLREPIADAARMALNISSTIANNIPAEKTEKSEELGKRTLDANVKTHELLSEVPAIANPWWQRNKQAEQQ